MSSSMKLVRVAVRAAAASTLALAFLLPACAPDRGVNITLRTDLVHGVEYSYVGVEIGGTLPPGALPWAATDGARVDGPFAADLTEGMQVAELRAPVRDPFYVRVVLFDEASEPVAHNVVAVAGPGAFPRAVTVLVPRVCSDVTCADPGAPTCAGQGACVTPDCAPGSPDCPVCQADDECPSASVSCLRQRCVEATCFLQVDDSVCAPGMTCNPALGCSDPAVDAGVRDGGMPEDASMMDAGPDASTDDGGGLDGADPVITPTLGWSVSSGGALGGWTESLAVDALGHVYFGSGTYLASVTSGGASRFARTFPSGGGGMTGIAIDSGSGWVAGSARCCSPYSGLPTTPPTESGYAFQGQFNLDSGAPGAGTVVVTGYSRDIAAAAGVRFVAAVGRVGSTESAELHSDSGWSLSLGAGPGGAGPQPRSVDADGSLVVLGGNVIGPVDLGTPATMATPLDMDAFLVGTSYANDPIDRRLLLIGDTGFDGVTAVAIGPDGFVWAAGALTGSFAGIGSGPGVFVIRVEPTMFTIESGRVFRQNAVGAASGQITDIAVRRSDGAVFVTGNARLPGLLDFDPAAPLMEVFAARIDPVDYSVVWWIRLGESMFSFQRIAVLPDGSVLVSTSLDDGTLLRQITEVAGP